MNPFEDYHEPTKVTNSVSTNPFDDHDGASSNPFTDQESNASIQDDVLEDGHTSAEASWQYLGSLPYRRVKIYSMVRWEKKVDNGFYGLASFPESTLASSRFSDPRALLNKSTVTKCAGCPNGGPIAVMTLPLTATTTFAPQTDLRILTVSGKALAQLKFPPEDLKGRYSPSDVLEIGFTSRCALILVLKDGLCLTYNLRGEPLLNPFFIFENGMDISLAHIYEGGVAVLAKNKDSAIVELLDSHDDPEYLQTVHESARRIVSPRTNRNISHETLPPHYAIVTPLPTKSIAAAQTFSFCAIAVLSRSRTLNRHPEVFLSTNDNSVIVVNAATREYTDVDCRARILSPIVGMSFAPNGRFLACFTENSMLTVISTSFETKVLDFDTSEGSNSPPLEMEWCGEDSVVLHWKNLGVLMVGPYGDWLRFPYEATDNLFLLPEIDCCRVITDSGVEILQRVPPATASLLRIGSIETTAMLLDASDAYHSGSPTSDEAARAIIATGMLEESIETCADSATKEFDIFTQKRLLRAASYGMPFSYKTDDGGHKQIIGGPLLGSNAESGLLPTKTTVNFVQSARKLRILNALRNPDVGFVLTAAQFDAMTPSGVVARLIAMKRPALAAEISKYLGLAKSVQLYARASKAAAFVELADSLSDSEAAERAIRILNGDNADGSSPGMNRGGYASVALAANKIGRPGVANLLLMLETSVADKVPALVSTGAYSDAIAVATTARDSDFIFSTLMEYERSCMISASSSDVARAQASFLSTVVSKFTPEAFHTLRRYLQVAGESKSLSILLLKAQRASDAGIAVATRAMVQVDSREKQGMLLEAARIFGLGKETAFHKSSTDDYLELLKDQETLKTKYGSSSVAPVSSSVTETIASVLRYAQTPDGTREQKRLLEDADKLGRKFRVPEKRLWHIKVKTFADNQQWSHLKSLSTIKRSPIGYKPFARAVIRGKQPESEIMFYFNKINAPEEKFDLLCEASMWEKALEQAEKMRDPRRIMNVKAQCNDDDLRRKADEKLGQLA